MNAASGDCLDEAQLRGIAENWPLSRMMEAATALTLVGHAGLVSYSRKVFIPLTHLCRDICSHCTFAHRPRKNGARI